MIWHNMNPQYYMIWHNMNPQYYIIWCDIPYGRNKYGSSKSQIDISVLNIGNLYIVCCTWQKSAQQSDRNIYQHADCGHRRESEPHRQSSVIIVWVLYDYISDSLLVTVTLWVNSAYTASDLVPRLSTFTTINFYSDVLLLTDRNLTARRCCTLIYSYKHQFNKKPHAIIKRYNTTPIYYNNFASITQQYSVPPPVILRRRQYRRSSNTYCCCRAPADDYLLLVR
jgi:hypothetical protein